MPSDVWLDIFSNQPLILDASFDTVEKSAACSLNDQNGVFHLAADAIVPAILPRAFLREDGVPLSEHRQAYSCEPTLVTTNLGGEVRHIVCRAARVRTQYAAVP